MKEKSNTTEKNKTINKSLLFLVKISKFITPSKTNQGKIERNHKVPTSRVKGDITTEPTNIRRIIRDCLL